MEPVEFERMYDVIGRDFLNAGRVSTSIKDTLKRLGVNPVVVRRVAIASYEAEMNVVMYAARAKMSLQVSAKTVAAGAYEVKSRNQENSQQIAPDQLDKLLANLTTG